MQIQEPTFYQAMRAVMDSPSDKEREVHVGRTVGNARTLVRDRDALAGEIARLEKENARLRSTVAKLERALGTED